MLINYENVVKYYVKSNIPRIFKLYTNHKLKKYKQRVAANIQQKEKFYNENGSYPIFSVIEIETHNRCNNTCSFCPVNKNDDTREYKKMSVELFTSIIQQLKDLKYKGSVGLYSNNEPLLDERLTDFARIAKEHLPEATIQIYTNGTLLTVDKFVGLMQYLDRIYIDNYSDKLKLIKPVQEVHDYCVKNKVYLDRVRIRLRKLHDVLSTRGGQAPNRKNEQIQSLDVSCLLPFRQMIVRPDGKISFCCNDALGKHTLGDLTKQRIEEVWNGEIYCGIRKNIIQSRANLPLCKGCDSLL